MNILIKALAYLLWPLGFCLRFMKSVCPTCHLPLAERPFRDGGVTRRCRRCKKRWQ